MKFSNILILLLIVTVVYAGAKIAPGYVHDMQLGSIVELTAKMYANPAKKRDIENFLVKKFHDIEDLPVTREDIKIEDNGDTVRVYVDWSHEAVFIPTNEYVPQFSRVYTFHEESIQPLKQ